MRRRDFNLLALNMAALGAASCALPKSQVREIAAACAKRPAEDEILRIDMHCHLLNLNDADGAAFLNRRYVNSRYVVVRTGDDGQQLMRPNRVWDRVAQTFARISDGIASLDTHTVSAETTYLERLAPGTPADEFCRETSERQRGLFLSDDASSIYTRIGEGRTSGFFSNRLRNASFMMAKWPEVDIFTPSMVDFYEGRGGERPLDQAKFYHQLHIATRGRFLPLISYHPERQMRERAAAEQRIVPSRDERFLHPQRHMRSRSHDTRPYPEITALDLVRKAVTDWGFIGVKLHQSAGYDPYDNAAYGCPNTRYQWQAELTDEEKSGYQQAMEDLYKLCDELQVPILTHGGDSISANPYCMHKADDPLEWSGSSAHWIKAIEKYKATGMPDVCLSHFASEFQDHIKARDGKYPVGVVHADYDGGNLKPSAWLSAAMTKIGSEPFGPLWLDLSCMEGLAYSQAARNGEPITTGNPVALEVEHTPEYAQAFERFMRDNPQLHDRILYGSDAHMPPISVIGRRYLGLIEELLPANARERIMGLNAVAYYGLQPGGANRGRLEAFYEENGIPLESTWIPRVDQALARHAGRQGA